jgi:hypothetical protein
MQAAGAASGHDGSVGGAGGVAGCGCHIHRAAFLRDEWVPLCRRLERSLKGEATDFIAFVFALIFFLHFQPKNRMSSPKTT